MFAACGSSAKSPAAPSPEDEKFSSQKWDQILPAGAEGVFAINLAALRTSPVFEALMAAGSPGGAVSAFRTTAKRCGIDDRKVRQVVVADYGQGRAVSLFFGDIDEAFARSCASDLVESRGAKLVSTEVAKHRAYHSSAERDRLWMSVPVTGSVIVASKRALLRDILNTASERESEAKSWLHRRASAIAASSAWMVFRVARDGRITEMLRLLSLDKGLAGASEVFAWADLGAELSLSLGIGFPDDDRAKGASEFLRQVRDLMKPPEAYEATVRSIDIRLSGSDVTLSVSLAPSQLDALLGNVTGSGDTSPGP